MPSTAKIVLETFDKNGNTDYETWLCCHRAGSSSNERMNKLLNQLLGFEVSTEVENLPRGQAKQTTHGED